MYRILFATLLLIFSCDSSTAPTDCAGVVNGTAVVDNCGECGGDGSTCDVSTCTAGGCSATWCAVDCACGCEGAGACACTTNGCACATTCTAGGCSAAGCAADCACGCAGAGECDCTMNGCTCVVDDSDDGDDDGDTTTLDVSVENFDFSPPVLTISVGETVTWTLTGGSHSVVSDDDGVFSSPSPSQPLIEPFQHTFEAAGVFGYHCGIHATMTGTITVTE